MRRITQHLIAAINAGGLTLALTYLMYQMVKTEDPELLSAPKFELPPFTTQTDDPSLITLMAKPTKPIEAELAPPHERVGPTDIPQDLFDPSWPEPVIKRKSVDLKFGGDQLVLVLGYPPVYPERHLSRGTQGFTVVGFSVDENGHVFNAQIIESQPPGVFDRASLKAISKFKYKPRVRAGKAIVAHNLRYKFSFKLDD